MEPSASIFNKVLDGTPIRRTSVSLINVKTSSEEEKVYNSNTTPTTNNNNTTTTTTTTPTPTVRHRDSYTNVQLHANRYMQEAANEALFKHDAALISQLQQENNLLKQQRIRDKTVISEYVTRTHNFTEEIKLKETFLEANKNLLQSIYKQLNILADLAQTKEIDHFKDHLSAVINTLSCHDTAIDILKVNHNHNVQKSPDKNNKFHLLGEIEQDNKIEENRNQEQGLYNIKTINDKVTAFRKLFSDVDAEEDKTHNTETDELLTNNNDVDIEAILADEILMLMKENKTLKQNSLKMEKNLKATTSTAIDLSLKEAEENSRLQLELLASNQEILRLRDKVGNLSLNLEEFRHREIELLEALEGVLIRVHELESNVWIDAVDQYRRPPFSIFHSDSKRSSPKTANHRPFKI